MTWIFNGIVTNIWNTIIHPFLDTGEASPPLKVWHGGFITPVGFIWIVSIYLQISTIKRTTFPNFDVSRSCLCAIHWSQVLNREWRCIGAAPTGDAPITSEWSTIPLPNKVWLMLEVWRFYSCSEFSAVLPNIEYDFPYLMPLFRINGPYISTNLHSISK